MKVIYKMLSVFLLVSFIFCVNSQVEAQVHVRSLDLGPGYYSPEMDYWNDAAISNWVNKFGVGFYGNLGLEIAIIKPISARINVGYWQGSASQSNFSYGDETYNEEIKTQLIPVTIDAIGRFGFEGNKLVLFLGAGGGMNYVTTKHTRIFSSSGNFESDLNGRDHVFYGLAGFDIPVGDDFAIGVELRYVWGKYKQNIDIGTNTIGADVSINGPQIFSAFKYLF